MGRREDQLRCSHCQHLLGIRVRGKAVALSEDGSGAIGDLLAIPCTQTFRNGRRCRGGWFDTTPEAIRTLEQVFDAAPTLRVPFGADEWTVRRQAPDPEPVGAEPAGARR